MPRQPENQTRGREPNESVRYWLKEITAAKKREEDFRKDGQRIIEIYEGHKHQLTPFNILFSNTETLLPALYSATPRPVVERRFKDADPLGKAAALAGQRLLEFLIDTNVEGYETFDEGARMATLDALLPGRAFTSVKYDVDTGVLPGGPPAEVPLAQAASSPEPADMPYTQSELVCIQTRSWNRVYTGYARKWSKVPWIAYEEQIDREEATRLFGKAIADELIYTEEERADADDHKEQDERDRGERRTCKIYQIWDKDGGRKIRYLNEQYQSGYLKEEDDPLELTGFFNCPKPLQFVEKSNSLLPTPMYLIYESQAKELNSITSRIKRLVRAIKAKGLYDSALGEDIKKLMEADDNEFVPAETPSSLAAEKGLGNALWFMPIEALINTLNQLYVARESCKQVIYEITGIADILRGASKASETLGAQKIKEAWGTLRIKNKQKEVQRYTRDLLRMMLEIAATKFSEQTWAKMTGLPYVTTMQRQQLEQVAQAAQMSQQPLDPQTQQMLQAPVWSQVIGMLKDDIQRAYRIDIETNSTIEPEAAEDQQQIADLMTAIGQFMNGVAPLVAKGVMPFQIAQSMLLAITRRFRFGSEIEDYIKQMQPPPPEQDGKAGEAAKQQAQMAQQQVQMQAQMAQMQTQLKTVEAEKQLNEQASALEIRELKVKTAEDMLKLEQQVTAEKLVMRDTTFQTKRSADDKVRSIKQAAENQQIPILRSVEQLAQMQIQLLEAVAKQSETMQEQMQERMSGLIQAVTAPRKRKAIRGKDGRLEAVEETVA